MDKLFCDLKTDEEKAAFFLSGRGYETGVISQAIQNDVAMAYHRCVEYKKELEALQSQDRGDEYPTRAAVEAVRLDDWRNQEYPEHCRTSCSDEHPINAEPNGHGCVRCNAILFAQHEFLLRHARRIEEQK